MIGSSSENSGKRLTLLLRILKKERIKFWEFRKKAHTVAENFKKKTGSSSENSGKRLASSGASFVKPTDNHHKLRRGLREPCASAGKRPAQQLRISKKERIDF
jgi:hypothetical protein